MKIKNLHKMIFLIKKLLKEINLNNLNKWKEKN